MSADRLNSLFGTPAAETLLWLALLLGLGLLLHVVARRLVLPIFRDTLLALVASVQLTNNDLVRVGDWIEMPQFGAHGDVIDIALHTVRVQNGDKTITVIPTHMFLDHSFRNWRFEVGGGRIKSRSTSTRPRSASHR